MIFVGIDVAKNKHDCFISKSNGEILFDVFTISNDLVGFDYLFQKIKSVCVDLSDLKVGLEATGHYSYNILGYLLNKGLPTFVINPLHTSLFRKSLSLRKTKTDKVDARTIAMLLMSDVNLKPYSFALYHNDELKSLSRYRLFLVKECSKYKQSLSRLVTILFPELEGAVSSLHLTSVYSLLSQYPGASYVASAHLTKLTNLLNKASCGRFDKNTAILIRDMAEKSVGSVSAAKSLELRHAIKHIQALKIEIQEIETEIKSLLDDINSPILSIPGMGFRMGAMIVAEIGDFNRFDSPDKILAYAGLAPSTYQSGKLYSSHSKMEKRGSRYLRYALFNAAKFVCQHDLTFSEYLHKKRSEGKHYYVAVSHAVKKLVRIIFYLEKNNQLYSVG